MARSASPWHGRSDEGDCDVHCSYKDFILEQLTIIQGIHRGRCFYACLTPATYPADKAQIETTSPNLPCPRSARKNKRPESALSGLVKCSYANNYRIKSDPKLSLTSSEPQCNGCNNVPYGHTECMLHIDQNFESAIDHAFYVKGHLLHIAHLFVFHHLCIDAIAVSPRLEHDIREHHGLAGL